MIIEANNRIFCDVDYLREFLIEENVVSISSRCLKCNGISMLKTWVRNNNKNIGYVCTVKGCQNKKSLFNTKLNVLKHVQTIYLLFSGATYKQLKWWCGISNTTIFAIKTKLRECYNNYISRRPISIGGPGVLVEVDETVLSRRGVISNPTTLQDEIADTVWVLGAIDQNKNFFVKKVENRRIVTLSRALEGVILVGSILRSDGHPSYPEVAKNLSVVHHVVNHSLGFVAPDGSHTNNIEGFWAHLKSEMRRENGVKRDNIDIWIDEYIFKRRFLKDITQKEFSDIFIEILTILLN